MNYVARFFAFVVHGVIGYFFFIHMTEWFLFVVSAMTTHYALKVLFGCSPVEYVCAYPEYVYETVKYLWTKYTK